MTTAADFLGSETAQHPLQTRGRWSYLAGYVMARVGLMGGVLALVAMLSGPVALAWVAVPAFVLSKAGAWVQGRAWWHVAEGQSDDLPRWRIARVGLATFSVGAALALAVLAGLPQWAAGATGVYFAAALIGFTLVRWSTTRALSMGLAESLAEACGVLVVAGFYVSSMESGQVRWAVAGGLAVAVLVSLFPKRVTRLMLQAGAWREVPETRVLHDVHGRAVPRWEPRLVAGDLRAAWRFRAVVVTLTIVAWSVLAAGTATVVAFSVGGLIFAGIAALFAWVSSAPEPQSDTAVAR